MTGVALHSADITQLSVDAIVNAANKNLFCGGGVDGAIHDAAGPKLLDASQRLAPCPPGNSRLTAGFNLNAKFLIHAVGPLFHDGSCGESEVLPETYRSAFSLAEQQKFTFVAFPCIAAVAYSFPPDTAV